MTDNRKQQLRLDSTNSDRTVMLTEYHTPLRHLLVGQSLTGFPCEQRVASPYNAFNVYETSSVEEEELQRLLTAQSEVES